MSRVVVREAVRELEIKGFVKILQGPTGGAYVTDLSFDHLQQRLPRSLSLQQTLGGRADPNRASSSSAKSPDSPRRTVDPEFTDRLQEALDAEQADAFTRRVCFQPPHGSSHPCGDERQPAASGHRESLFRLTGEVILEVKPVQKVIHRPEEHAEIVRTVLSHDPDAAASAMKQHLECMRKRLIRLEGSYRNRKGVRRFAAA